MDRPKERSRGRWRRRLLLAVLALPVVLLVTWLTVDVAGRWRAHAARERIVERGEPLTLAELAERYRAEPRAGEGADPVPWLLRVEALRGVLGDTALDDVFSLEDVLATETLAPETRAVLEELRDCLADENPLVFERLEDPRGGPLRPCERAWVRAHARANAPALPLALEAARYAPIDAERMVRDLAASDEPLPLVDGHVLRGAFDVDRALGWTALHYALESRPAEAVRLLVTLARVATILAPMPWLDGNWVASVPCSVLYAQLRRALPHLPAEQELGELERCIEAHDPRAALRRALIAERAAYLRILDDFSAQLFEAYGAGSVWPLVLGPLLTHDEAFLLAELERGLAELEQPAWELDLERVPDVPRWSFFSALLLPKVGELRSGTAQLEAERALALVALRAHQDGVAAARTLAARTPDPFDGAPLRTRVGAGWLVIWSVGPDGVDDGAQVVSEELGEILHGFRGTDLVWFVPAD